MIKKKQLIGLPLPDNGGNQCESMRPRGPIPWTSNLDSGR